MTIQFKKAERSQSKLKLGIQGPSGSGKTDGALAIAHGLAGPTGRIAVADTENGSASLYSDRYDFDALNIEPPYLSSKFGAVIDAAVDAGYDVLILDSISHQWEGEGGVLSRKEAVDAHGGNSYTNWSKFTKEHNEFVGKILSAPIHIIATMRSKQDYVLEANEKGKQAPRKVGMKAIQREGAEYQFTVNLDVQMDHRAKASKDRTNLFGDALWDLRDPKTSKMIVDWLASAKPEAKVTPEQIETMLDLAAKISDEASDATQKKIKLGMTEEAASRFIQKLEARIAQGATA